MFLDRDTTGGDGLNMPISKHMHSIHELEKIQIVSNTGNRERREIIQSWNAKELVRIHNLLVAEITKNGVISMQQKNILQSMEQEWISTGWTFTWKIQENEWYNRVDHLEWMSRYNSLQWTTDILKWETRLRMWSII
jgi:hypothetical protein